MKKHIKNFVLLTAIVSTLILIANKLISIFSNMRDYLPFGGGKFYNWKYGDIYYIKTGKGKPVLLIHDLDPSSSSYEWNKVIKKSNNHLNIY